MEKQYQALRRTMIVTIVLVSLAPLLGLSVIGGYQFQSAYSEKVLAHVEQLVLKHRQNVDGFLREKLAEIQVVADILDGERLQDEALLEDVLLSLQRRHGGVFVDIGVVGAGGLQTAYAGPFRLEEADYSQALWFREAMRRDHYISDVFLGLRGLPHFIVAVKRVWNGEVRIVRSTIDFVAFNELVDSIRLGRTGQAYIVNREGGLQTRSRGGFVPDPDTMRGIVRLVQAAGARQGGSGDVPADVLRPVPPPAMDVRPGPHGEPLLYLAAPLKDGSWYLVYQQDESEAFAEFYHARLVALVGVLLSGAAIVFMAVVLSRRMVGSIVRADKDKERMNEQIVEAGKLVSVGELAAGIAHEINNPVAIMMEEAGWIGDLMDEEAMRATPRHAEIMESVAQVRGQGRRCREITHKLLSFARKLDPTPTEVDVNDLVSEMADLSEQRARYANVTMVTDFDEGLPHIHASCSEMQQVLLNLVNNAIDAMESGGGELRLGTARQGDELVISVADTGAGIPQANLPRIFDPFFTTKPVGKGTGLGLSIIYGIVKKMGGEITVASSVGVGTTFTIRLPLPRTDRDARGGGHEPGTINSEGGS
ncbi:sensor histidine kinase [Desulfocurvus sp. DL9XJH121]